MYRDPDVLVVVSLSSGMMTATPKTPAGDHFLGGWEHYDGESLILEISYAHELQQEGEADGIVVHVIEG